MMRSNSPSSQPLIGLHDNAHRPWSHSTLSMVYAMEFPIPVTLSTVP